MINGTLAFSKVSYLQESKVTKRKDLGSINKLNLHPLHKLILPQKYNLEKSIPAKI